MVTVNSISVRIPAELKNWAVKRSMQNFRSLSAEVVAILTRVREGELQIIGEEKVSGNSCKLAKEAELSEGINTQYIGEVNVNG